MKNYQEADEMLQGRNKESRKLDNHTYLLRHPDSITIRLHRTDIVTYYPDGKTMLTSGGWKTPTTKNRINQFSPVEIMQAAGRWYLLGENRENRQVFFYDGMIIKKNGKVAKLLKNDPTDRIMKLINRYCKKLAEMPILPKPDGGDCWYCLMKTEDGKTLGDTVGNNDHIENHLKDQYIHGSLIVNAMKVQGMGNAYFYYAFNPASGETPDFVRPAITRAVKRYLKLKMGIAR